MSNATSDFDDFCSWKDHPTVLSFLEANIGCSRLGVWSMPILYVFLEVDPETESMEALLLQLDVLGRLRMGTGQAAVACMVPPVVEEDYLDQVELLGP